MIQTSLAGLDQRLHAGQSRRRGDAAGAMGFLQIDDLSAVVYERTKTARAGLLERDEPHLPFLPDSRAFRLAKLIFITC